MDADPGTPEGEELDVLTDLVEHHEKKHVPMGYPSAVAAIGFRLEQADLTQRDLVPFIGSRAKVSEVLSGKRQLQSPCPPRRFDCDDDEQGAKEQDGDADGPRLE